MIKISRSIIRAIFLGENLEKIPRRFAVKLAFEEA